MNFSWLGIGPKSTEQVYLPEVYPLALQCENFIKADVQTIYAKILTDVVERTQGVPEDAMAILWDNCLQSETSEGLVTRLSKAMECKSDLFLVYNSTTQTIRTADNAEQAKIKANYAKDGETSLGDGLVGIYVSFKHYSRTDMVKLYSALEYAAIASLHKNMNLSKAIQYKINDLRASVSLVDSAKAQSQAADIAGALSKGKDVYLDAKDVIDSHKPDLDATGKSIEFIESKRCFYLGLPMSYITGVAPKGLGDSGEGDAKAVERGLKNYFEAILKPVLEALFPTTKMEFKTQDFRMITQALEALKTFQLVGDDLISKAEKRVVIEKLLDFDPDSEDAPDPNEEAKPLPAPLPAAVPPNKGDAAA